MAKSNDKKNRTKGTVKSSGIEFPQPMTGANSPTSDLNYTDKDRAQSHFNSSKQL